MKLFISTLAIISSLFFGLTVDAKNMCNESAESLGAKYSIKKTLLIPKPDNKISNNNEMSFQLWRKGCDVLHINSTEQLSVVWHKLSNSKVQQIRYFDQYQRGIELEPVKVSSNNWENTLQLISTAKLTKMSLLETAGKAADLIEHYRLNDGDSSIEVWWQPAIKVAQKIIYRDNYYETVWLLTEKVLSTKKIDTVFAQRQNYQMTDYADIGDNESDPFLRKMIHLGFVKHGSSGFYDANGNTLSSNHLH